MSSTATFRITRISAFKTARIMALMYAVAAVPYAFFAQTPMWMIHAFGWKRSVDLMLVVYPLGYAVGGFFFTLVGAGLYNLVASRIGGIEWTLRYPDQQGE